MGTFYVNSDQMLLFELIVSECFAFLILLIQIINTSQNFCKASLILKDLICDQIQLQLCFYRSNLDIFLSFLHH